MAEYTSDAGRASLPLSLSVSDFVNPRLPVRECVAMYSLPSGPAYTTLNIPMIKELNVDELD